MQYLGHSSDVQHGNNKDASHALPRLDLKTAHSPIAACHCGWTGFFIKVRDNIVVIQSTIGYLDTLGSPATDLKTTYGVICLGCEIKERLKLKAVACVFDQALYAKAMGVFWKHKAQFEGLEMMMSGFHLLMTMLAITGSRFADAGLRDVAVQSEIIAEGSVDSVLNGKHYNRAVRLHK